MALSIDWNIVGVVTAIIVALGGIIAWFLKSTFRFGEISQRLTAVESDVKALTLEVKGTNKRMDDLILILAQNGAMKNPTISRRLNKPRTTP